MRYRAFISYAHADERWARWLHRSIERYQLPRRLVAELGLATARLRPLFRDRDELRAAASLSEAIREALAESEALIVVCSPAAAESKWVNEEIEHFRSLGHGEIHCIIVDGYPANAFPAALLAGGEPLAADPRPAADGSRNAKLKLIAALLGIPFDQLRQRESLARQRRLAAVAAGSVLGMILTGGLATLAVISQQQAEAERARALVALEEAQAQRARAEREAKTTQRVSDFLIGLFRMTDPNEARGEIPTTLEIVDRGVERIYEELAEEPEVRAPLLEMMGNIYVNLGLVERARPLLDSLIDYAEQTGQPLAIAQAYNDAAEMETFLGNYETALGHLETALAALDVEDDINLRGVVYDNVSEAQASLGNLQEARIAFEQALAIAEYRNDPAQLFVRRNDLGEMLAMGGDYPGAREVFERNLAFAEESFGAEHVYAADALNNLSWVNQRLDRPALARAQLERSIAITEAQYDIESPKLAASLINLAQMIRRSGDPAGALPVMERAAGIFRETTKRDYPHVLVVLAGLQLELGDAETAKRNYEESLALHLEQLGPEHLWTGRSEGGLGRAYAVLGDAGRARRYLEQGLEVVEAATGPEHPNVAEELMSGAPMLALLGDAETARRWTERAVAIYEATFDESHSLVQKARRQLMAYEP